MKVQCSCGTRYSFDLTPEMAERPIQFVCQKCGVDSSAAVNEMIRQQLKLAPAGTNASAPPAATPPAAPPPPAPAPPALPSLSLPVPARPMSAPGPITPPSPPSAGGGRLQISRPASPAAAGEPATASEAPAAFTPAGAAPPICLTHNRRPITHHCLVCNKPMCTKCLELFGYVCSPFCRNKAEAQGIEVPVCAGQRSVGQHRHWRKVGLAFAGIGAVAIGLAGFWIWYAWFGSVPKPIFSVRFAESAYSGHSQICGQDQIIFLHGETLARHDMKSKKEIWSHDLLDKKQIETAVNLEIKATEALIRKANDNAWDHVPKMPDRDKLAKLIARAEADSLQLYVSGSNVWVAMPGKLVRYDWETGNQAKEFPLPPSSGDWSHQNDELISSAENGLGQMVVTHLSLASGESRAETFGLPEKPAAAVAGKGPGAPVKRTAGAAAGGSVATAGLPLGTPGADRGKAMDPDKVADQAARLPFAAKLALPATLSNSRNQERILNELNDRPGGAAGAAADRLRAEGYFSFVPCPDGYVKFSARVLEEKIITRKVMKDPPKKSALNGDVNASSTVAVANEILNEMQRERSGDTEEEDQSRYQATVRLSDGNAPDWVGEVIGPPSLHPLKTVNVVSSANSLTVLDKANKKLWQASITHPVPGGHREFGEADPAYGLGPCVERGDRLYVFDKAVLTCFDLATGNVNWRVPSIGIENLFFDNQGMLYLNTTSADPESLKYSKQIDIAAHNGPIVIKIDPKAGKIVWASGACGPILYLSGKFIYTMSAYSSGDDEEENPFAPRTGLETPTHLQIRRINPSNGHQMWEHYEQRAPFDVQFDGNVIRLVFKKEVEVLKFLSL